jgi:hypothetical protein
VRFLVSLSISVLMALSLACSSSGGGSSGGGTLPTQGKTMTAEQVLGQLKQKGLPVGKSLTYTAANDPEKLLGRPGGYTSKVNFQDSRLEAQSTDMNVQDGGSVEVFANENEAVRRWNDLENAALDGKIPTEYDYQEGPIVLRLSKRLQPDQAKAYDTAIE